MIAILAVVIVLVYFAYNQSPSIASVNPHPHSVCFDLVAEGVMWKVDFSTSRIWRLANHTNHWIEFHMWRGDAQNWSLRLSDQAWWALRQQLLTPNPEGGGNDVERAGPLSDLEEAPDWKPFPEELKHLIELRYQYLHSGYTHTTQYQQYVQYQHAQPYQPGQPAPAYPENVYAPPADQTAAGPRS